MKPPRPNRRRLLLAAAAHRVLCALVLVSAITSTTIFGAKTRTLRGYDGIERSALMLPDAPYARTITDLPLEARAEWQPPRPLARGEGWTYDLFTPPEIFYHEETRTFTVTRPAAPAGRAPTAFGMELISVRQELFRLQLVGYMGAAGNWRGVFVDTTTGEVFLATAGERLKPLALTISKLAVDPRITNLPDRMPLEERLATALIQEDSAGREIMLSQGVPQPTGSVMATVRIDGESAVREVCAGEVLVSGEVRFEIERITASPPSLVVARHSADDASPIHRVLSPVIGPAADLRGADAGSGVGLETWPRP